MDSQHVNNIYKLKNRYFLLDQILALDDHYSIFNTEWSAWPSMENFLIHRNYQIRIYRNRKSISFV